jgi:hypothetical protein
MCVCLAVVAGWDVIVTDAPPEEEPIGKKK